MRCSVSDTRSWGGDAAEPTPLSVLRRSMRRPLPVEPADCRCSPADRGLDGPPLEAESALTGTSNAAPVAGPARQGQRRRGLMQEGVRWPEAGACPGCIASKKVREAGIENAQDALASAFGHPQDATLRFYVTSVQCGNVSPEGD